MENLFSKADKAKSGKKRVINGSSKSPDSQSRFVLPPSSPSKKVGVYIVRFSRFWGAFLG